MLRMKTMLNMKHSRRIQPIKLSVRRPGATGRPSSAGFSLIEVLISLGVFLVISAMVMGFMVDMTMTQGTTANRAEMHSNVRSATEILQQEISQAGRISFPTSSPVTLSQAITIGTPPVEQTVNVSSTTPMFGTTDPRILLIVGWGAEEETVAARVVSATSISAIFRKAHANGVPIRPAGAFINGILTWDNASAAHQYTLMMYGDINDNGNMVFVRYDCMPTAAGDGKLWRREIPWNTPAVLATINANYPPQVLLTNLKNNPDNPSTLLPEPCFSYQARDINWPSLHNGAVTISATAATSNPAVLNLAVTMSSRTQFRDPNTNQYQYQTKALLTVSPRNVFQAFNMASNLTGSQHVQETPAEIVALAALNLTPP